MAVMYSFCKYFSVRLGTIMVAIVSLIQSLLLGAGFLFCLNDVKWTSSYIESLITSYKLIYVTELLMSMEQNTRIYLQCAVVFLMLHIYVCGLVIYAALKCNVPLAWPFLVVEFIRLGVLFFFHFTLMIFIKENFLDLGLLIALCLSGGFILLGLYYMWFCVLSLCQCIQELNQDPFRRASSGSVNLLASDFKLLTNNLEERFALPPVSMSLSSPTFALQPVPGLRLKDYQLGNLGWSGR